MIKRWAGLGLALGVALTVSGNVLASNPKPKHRAKVATKAKAWTGAESGLIGIKLYDSGLRVLQVYGTPDQVEPLSGGGMSLGSGGQGAPGGPGMGGPGGPGMGMRGRPGGMGGPPTGMGGPGMAPGRPGGGKGGDMIDPFSFGDSILGDTSLNQAAGLNPGFNGGGGAPAPLPPGSQPGMGGRPGGMGGGAGIPGAGGGSSDRVTFTRWVYNREGSKYGFIIDKQGRVVQIEAIGIDNSRVKTKRGVGFGSTFAGVLTDYQQPDGYEIAGDNLTVKYLVHDNVAFRLSRLGPKKPQVVTGIVVAAGKS